MSDVYSFVTLSGEIIGRLKEEKEDRVVVSHPRVFMQTQEGAGFLPGVCMTGKKEPETAEILKAGLIMVVESAPELAKAWQQQTSGLILP